MSVLASKRKESREEAIAYSLELYEGLFNKTITIVKKKMIIKDRSQQESTWEVA